MSKSIRLYLDQMIQKHVADTLADDVYNVVRASEFGQSRADDRAILEKAIIEHRILVTLDDHFGDWAVLPLNEHPSVIRLKVNPTTSHNILDLIGPFLHKIQAEQVANHLIILPPIRKNGYRLLSKVLPEMGFTAMLYALMVGDKERIELGWKVFSAM